MIDKTKYICSSCGEEGYELTCGCFDPKGFNMFLYEKFKDLNSDSIWEDIMFPLGNSPFYDFRYNLLPIQWIEYAEEYKRLK